MAPINTWVCLEIVTLSMNDIMQMIVLINTTKDESSSYKQSLKHFRFDLFS